MSLKVASGHSGEVQLSHRKQDQPAETAASLSLVDDMYDEVHADLMRFLAFRVRNPAESEDLAQEAYLRLLKSDRAAVVRNPRAYLFRIAANLLVDRGRLEKRRIRTVPWAPKITGRREGRPDALEQFLWRERVKLVAAAVRELPERCKQALILHRREGWTYEMIATELGVSRSMVKKYLRQALIACLGALDDEGEPPSGSLTVGEDG